MLTIELHCFAKILIPVYFSKTLFLKLLSLFVAIIITVQMCSKTSKTAYLSISPWSATFLL